MNLITVEADGTLPGIDDVLRDLDPNVDDKQLLAELDRAGIPYETSMGRLSDWLGRIRELFRSRQLVSAELETCNVPILEFHVPPHGTGELMATRSEGQAGTLRVSIYGSGGTSGCAAKVSLSEKFEKRKTCIEVEAELSVKRCVYRVGDEEQIVWSPEKILGYRQIEKHGCDRCGIERSALDPWSNDLGEYLDFRQDSVSHTRKLDVKWSDSSAMQVGLQIGKIGGLSFVMKTQSAVVWTVEYGFGPRLLYQPYTRQKGAAILRSPAWVIEGPRE